MKVYTTYNKKPISHNSADTKAKTRYRKDLQNQFVAKYQKLYTGLPIKDTVEIRIAYYNRVRYRNQCIDIDNISKPTVDAYKGYIYEDDRQVIQRIAMKYDVAPLEIVDIDCSDMPFEVAREIEVNMKSNCEHMIIFSVTTITKKELMNV